MLCNFRYDGDMFLEFPGLTKQKFRSLFSDEIFSIMLDLLKTNDLIIIILYAGVLRGVEKRIYFLIT